MKVSGTIILIYFLIIFGWVRNIYLLAQCNFTEPFKTEVIRGVGIIIFPIGVVTGYINMNDD
jgi:hypothetical protein